MTERKESENETKILEEMMVIAFPNLVEDVIDNSGISVNPRRKQIRENCEDAHHGRTAAVLQ